MDQCDRGVAELPRSKLERLGAAAAAKKLRSRPAEPQAPIDTDSCAEFDTDTIGYVNTNANGDDESVCHSLNRCVCESDPQPHADDNESDVATEGSHQDGLPRQTEVRRSQSVPDTDADSHRNSDADTHDLAESPADLHRYSHLHSSSEPRRNPDANADNLGFSKPHPRHHIDGAAVPEPDCDTYP